MAVNERAKTTVYLDGKQAEAALAALGNKAQELRRDLKAAQKAGDNIKMKGIERELKRVEAAQRSMKKETFDVERVLKDINKVSLRDLEKAQRSIRSQMKGMTRDTQDYVNKEKDLKKITNELSRARGVMRQKESLWSRMANGVNKYAGVVAGIAATVTGLAFSIKEWIQGLVGMDDALADVMKTTGMTRKEVREMYQDFKSFNTRTPRRELLLLAEEAGRLGKTSRKDVMDFVEVANQIKVALGDDLGGEASVAIREVGKLTEIYKVNTQYGTEFKDSMLKVGSAINEVSANSNAQAPFLIDYLKRMGGVAVQTNTTAAEVIGYASALDQLGQKQEMAATAHGKILVDMFKDHAKYADIARMSADDFFELLQTDANEAFLKLLEGLNGNNGGMSEMAAKLDGLGVDGARAVQVLAALSSNVNMVRDAQDLANEAMDEGISLTNEYNVKNNNLAGSYAKIGQYLHSKFINSKFLGWLENVVGKVAEWVEIPLSENLSREQYELNHLVTSIISANDNQRVRNSLIQELQNKYPDFLGNLDTEKVTNQQLRDMLIEVNAQYRDRIKLAALQEKSVAVQKEGIELAGREQEILEEVNKLYQQFRYEGLGPAETFEEQVAAFEKAGERHGFIAKGVIAGVQNLGSEYDALQGKIQANIDDYQKWQDLANKVQTRIGGAGAGAGGGKPAPGGGGSGGGFSPGGNTDEFDMSILDPADEGEIDMGWMTAEIKADAERYAEKMRNEEEWTEFLEAQIEKQLDAQKRAFEIEAEIEQAREDLKEMRINAIGQIAGALSGMFEQGSAAQIAFFALEKAMGIAQVWISYAKESAAIHAYAATMGPLGIAYEAAMQPKALLNAKLNTAIIAAQAIGQVASSIGGKKKEKKEGYADGGYTGPGGKYEYAGPVHKGEYVIPQDGVQNPDVRQFIDWMEVARRSGSLAQLRIPPQVVSMGSGQRSGYASGGHAGETTTPSANLPQPYTPEPDPALLKAITRLNDNLEKGITANIKKYGVGGLDDELGKIQGFKSKVFKQ